MYDFKESLRDLVELHGAPGFEDDVRNYLIEQLQQCGIQNYQIDNAGNLLVEVKGTDPTAPSVHLDAHMDEPCFMVKYIDENGFIYPASLGFLVENVLVAQRLLIHTHNGPVHGTFGVKSFHLTSTSDKQKPLELDDMWIDIGASSREEAIKLGIKPGQPITFDARMIDLPNDCVMAKAFDNRIGVVVALEVIRNLVKHPSKSSVYVSFSVQEELILRGAIPVFRGLKEFFNAIPYFSLTFDICLAGDYPSVVRHRAPIDLNKGPGIKIYDKSRASHYHQVVPARLVNKLEEIAIEKGVPYQYDFLAGSTNADVFAMEHTGILAGGISIPCRYTHTPVEIVSLRDTENAIRLTVEFIHQVTEKF